MIPLFFVILLTFGSAPHFIDPLIDQSPCADVPDLASLQHECQEHGVEAACNRLQKAMSEKTPSQDSQKNSTSTVSQSETTTPVPANYPRPRRYTRKVWSDWIPYQERPVTNFYYFHKYFSKEQVDEIISTALTLPPRDGTVFSKVGDTSVVSSYRRSQVRWLPKDDRFMWLYDELAYMALTANEQMWKFDVNGMYEDIQFTEYYGNEKGFYDWHVDIGESTAMRKISLVVMLSDPNDYEGGRLQFKTSQLERDVPHELGTVILFPPYFLHRVSPVIGGLRRTLVLWVSGPPLR
jgi:PKHD-type hydroxylase